MEPNTPKKKVGIAVLPKKVNYANYGFYCDYS